MDIEFYRLVPHRFAFHHTDADICKLEKLTNLFPDMKDIIELELFKMNNLERLINRLSSVYTPIKVIDKCDDTSHIYLGPYHLSLGSESFGALHFKNISTAALTASLTSSSSTEGKRRHDIVLRRFRRAVRKLIYIKSIIDRLRLASVLTPYNQYELYTKGIYDLVLDGHQHNSTSEFYDNEYLRQIDDFRSMNKFEQDHIFLASKYVQINTLLHLLTPSPYQHDHQSTTRKKLDENPTQTSMNSVLDKLSICCAKHAQSMPVIMFPMKSTAHQQAKSLLPTVSNSQITKSNAHNSITKSSTNHEEVFVKRISSLLTNYLFIHQSTYESNHFDQLLEQIKSIVDKNITHHGNVPKKPTHLSRSTRRSLSHHGPTKDEDKRNMRRSLIISKSQSFDEMNLNFNSTIPE